MSAPTKTVQTALVAWQDCASAAQVISSAFNCASIWAASTAIQIGRRTGTAFTAGWPNIRIEASPQSSGGIWLPLYLYQPLVGASIVNTTLNGAVSAAATSFVVTSATNIAVGDLLFLGDTSTSNYEVVRVKAVSGTTITPEEAVLNGHATGAIVTDQAEVAYPSFDLSTYTRLRAVIDNMGSGQNISALVTLLTFDSY